MSCQPNVQQNIQKKQCYNVKKVLELEIFARFTRRITANISRQPSLQYACSYISYIYSMLAVISVQL